MNPTTYDRLYPEKKMVRDAKRRALKSGLAFNITHEDVVIPEVCPLLGLPLKRGDRDACPTLDRINSSRGYTRGNIWVLSMKANRIKNNATVEELEQIAFSLRAHTLKGGAQQ